MPAQRFSCFGERSEGRSARRGSPRFAFSVALAELDLADVLPADLADDSDDFGAGLFFIYKGEFARAATQAANRDSGR